MRSVARILGLLAALVGGATCAHAALVWETTRLNLTLPADQKSAEAIFVFENRGGSAVTIRAVRLSCGCTESRLAKETWAAGEKGELRLVIDRGHATGQLRVTADVATDTSDPRPTQLEAIVQLPELLELSPRVLTWEKDAPATPRDIRLVLAAGVTGDLSVRTPPDSGFDARILPAAAGIPARLEITPRDTTAARQEVLMVTLTRAGAADYSRKVYVRIR